jgi:hypothetical protein
MAKVWKILVRKERSEDNSQPSEWFLVAADDQETAARTLRMWRDFSGSHELRVLGEADDRLVAWAGATNIEPGEICPVAVVS